jgi:hypothetical protein
MPAAKKLTALVLGSEQQRALGRAAAAAIQSTAAQLAASSGVPAEQLAMVVGEVFTTWTEALVSGYFPPGVALSRDDRIAAIEQLSVLACTGLREDRLQVDLKDYTDLQEWRRDDRQLQPIIGEVRNRLGRAGHNRLDVRLTVTWGTQLGLVEAHGNAVRFPTAFFRPTSVRGSSGAP